ncbi:MAG: GNAT family N-acetyltransferase [Eubacteriales bacterium]|nr:GNAT family N-acetyltransferase [Eubacteriales bacterium]
MTGRDVSDWETFLFYRNEQEVYLTEDEILLQRITAAGYPCVCLLEEGAAPPWGVRFAAEREALTADYLSFVWHRFYRKPQMIAVTAHLMIRESVMEDLPAFLEMYRQERQNPDVTAFTEEPEQELYSYIRVQYEFFDYGLWTITLKENGSVIGRGGLTAYSPETDTSSQTKSEGTDLELAYLIAEEFRGCGFGAEAAEAFVKLAAQRFPEAAVYLRTSPENRASAAIAGSLGGSLQKSRGRQQVYLIDL